MFYAEYSPYGCRTLSDGDVLLCFDTREERDAKVEELNDRHPELSDGVCRAVTVRQVRHRYDFNYIRGFDPWGEQYREVTDDPTNAGNTFFRLEQRPNRQM